MKICGDETTAEDSSCGKRGELVAKFSKNQSERYNVGTHKARRLNKRIAYMHISVPETYCVPCSWSLRSLKDGKVKIKRKGSRQIQSGETCKQAICSSCGEDWQNRGTVP